MDQYRERRAIQPWPALEQVVINVPQSIAIIAVAANAFLCSSLVAPATELWMTEEAMRAAFIGKTLDGHYTNGLKWTETYASDGRLDYRESGRRAAGNWHFRSRVFCTLYDRGPQGAGLAGGCWTVVEASRNCYEFYAAGANTTEPVEDDIEGAMLRWTARGWRRDEPSTCKEKPSV